MEERSGREKGGNEKIGKIKGKRKSNLPKEKEIGYKGEYSKKTKLYSVYITRHSHEPKSPF